MDAFVENITLTKIHVSKNLTKKPTFYPSCPFFQKTSPRRKDEGIEGDANLRRTAIKMQK